MKKVKYTETQIKKFMKMLKKKTTIYTLIFIMLSSKQLLNTSHLSRNLLIDTDNDFKFKVENCDELNDEEVELLYDSIYKEIVTKNIVNIQEKNSEDLYTTYMKDILLNNQVDNGLESYLYTRMARTVREKETLTKEQLNSLLNNMCKNDYFGELYETPYLALKSLYENDERTYEEKALIIMARENLTFNQLDTICAGMIAEGGNYYDETYRTSSVVYNRAHCSRWINLYGSSIYSQFIGKGQFEVYSTNQYKKYLGKMDFDGYKGALDMFYSREPSIPYLSFRGKNFDTGFAYEQYLSNGNKFGIPIKDKEVKESDYITTIEEELNEDYSHDYSLYLTLK